MTRNAPDAKETKVLPKPIPEKEWEDWQDRPDPDAGFKRLSAEEARELRKRSPQVSPWRVIVGQIIVGILVALAAWGLTGQKNIGWSAGYGALSVVIPAAVFARGLTGRLASLNPSTAMLGFFVWEMVKLALTVAMLFAAPRLVTALSWPAMLVGLVVAMQAYWLAVILAPGRKQRG
ncbi:ATP synthase subunit I [Variovorax dokdonensis]|uniref:ATP synthase subunit I n=1 Tax=Variovorax dokdonensis TaxID=344883 RepID=A0ABT7NG15_9BURK|nr:ATP synthase subunit I [Variovorax dokdonensis]MDM0046894.1 ATP synthase subunit I [Variovorax dokdonensis]